MSQYVVPALCIFCKHFDEESSMRATGPTCRAFPGENIPQEIISSQHDHRTPLRGEKLLFEPKPGTEELVKEWERVRLEWKKTLLKSRYEEALTPDAEDDDWE